MTEITGPAGWEADRKRRQAEMTERAARLLVRAMRWWPNEGSGSREDLLSRLFAPAMGVGIVVAAQVDHDEALDLALRRGVEEGWLRVTRRQGHPHYEVVSGVAEPVRETVVGQFRDGDRWRDYARATPEEAAAWVAASPADRRGVDWETGAVVVGVGAG